VAARRWLDAYAPERARMAVARDALPDAAEGMDAAQRSFAAALAARLADPEVGWSGDVLQAAIFEAARDAGLPAGRAFAGIYLAFLGQPSGPRAGWLLASLEREFVVARLRAATSPGTLSA
jgi:lysyl-tRNA synthetase class 1